MRKFLFCIIILCLVTHVSFATAQYPDKIWYKGKEYALHTNPLEEFFDKNPDRRPQSDIMSTALWRGYIGTFEFDGDQLIVKEIEVMVPSNNGDKWKSVLKEIFPDEPVVKISWISGILVLPYGKIKNYVHMGYASTYSHYILLEVDNGVLKKEKQLDGDRYDAFKTRQFEAFKLTDEYKTLKADMMKQENSSEASVDEFIRIYAISYSKKLVD
ncbi:MAG TPA: hypothetical protein VK666_30280 [Chryseolinea sp.]|nr:hypothetical protein [Chryseolinea sp.]